jgi:hypothetical protein
MTQARAFDGHAALLCQHSRHLTNRSGPNSALLRLITGYTVPEFARPPVQTAFPLPQGIRALITRARPMSTNIQIPSPPSISCACNADALQVGVGMSCSLRSYIRSTACFTSTSIRPLNRHARWHGEDRGNWRESWCRLRGNIKRILHDLHSSCGLTGIRYVRARSPPESRHRRVLLLD